MPAASEEAEAAFDLQPVLNISDIPSQDVFNPGAGGARLCSQRCSSLCCAAAAAARPPPPFQHCALLWPSGHTMHPAGAPRPHACPAEGSCRFVLAKQFLEACAGGVSDACCSVVADQWLLSSSAPFTTCLCQPTFWRVRAGCSGGGACGVGGGCMLQSIGRLIVPCRPSRDPLPCPLPCAGVCGVHEGAAQRGPGPRAGRLCQ